MIKDKIIDMKSFENMVETSTKGEFNDIILTLKDKKIDESHGRVERFDMKNIGNFYENTVENYLKELSSVKPLKEDEILELLKKIKDGDSDSREILIEGLLKLVAKIALRYAKVGASYIELVQEGLMGIVTAIENYKFDFNMKFTEYLEFWIKYAMIQSNKKVVDELKSPVVTYFKHLKVEVYSNNNKEVEEFDKEDIKKVLNMELEEFENLKKISEYGFLIKEEDKEQLEEYKSIAEIDKELEKIERLMLVSNLANKFTNEEIKMLDMYYGLSGKRKFFEDIGKVMDMDANKVKTEIDKLMVKLKYNGKREWINEN
jgi:RNA polymerase primary sigma factor